MKTRFALFILILSLLPAFAPDCRAQYYDDDEEEAPVFVAAASADGNFIFSEMDASSPTLSPVEKGEVFQVLMKPSEEWLEVYNVFNHLEGYVQASKMTAQTSDLKLPACGKGKDSAVRYASEPDASGAVTEWLLWEDRVGNLCAQKTTGDSEENYTGRKRQYCYVLSNRLDSGDPAARALSGPIAVWGDLAGDKGIYVEGVFYRRL